MTEHSAPRASMVYLPGMQTEARSVKPGQLVEMFDSSWRARNIWDGVRLEVAEDRSPVVLNSFTHLDPDLPLLEVRRGSQVHDAEFCCCGGDRENVRLALEAKLGRFRAVILD